MSVELIDRKTGEVFATCVDLEYARKHMQFWGLTLRTVEMRIKK